ncbi:MAG: hypothetical protein HPY79_07885 [Bacteroidales bacterium]|nr:hypothetical protein [Bacteroidales bacterium]
MKLYLLFVLFFQSCTSSFIITKATSQYWCVKEKNIEGINYHILLKTKASYVNVTFDSLTVNNASIKDFSYSVIGKSINEQKFNQGDTIIVSFNKIGEKHLEPIRIYYRYKQRPKSILISNIKELQSLCP